MKTKHLIIILSFTLFNSCIIKSLKPFYVQEALEFQDAFLGQWEDQGSNIWEISSVKAHLEAEQTDTSKVISEEDLKLYEIFKDGYYVSYIEKEEGKDDIENHFIAMPFKVKDVILIDFLPFYLGEVNNNLPQAHLLKTHSVAKLDITDNKKVKLTWIDEDRINELYEKKQIRLDREIIGFEGAGKDFVLTASSRELYQFLKKFISSDIKNKWESDIKFTLNKTSDIGKPLKVY